MEAEPTIETPNTKAPEPVQNTITKTPPPRVKNPKRVAQGKKLAAISKAAKQRKKERLETEKQQQDKEDKEKMCTTSLITFTGTILGTCCTLLLTYIAYRQWKKEEKTDPKTIKKSPVVYKDLSQYDL